MRDKFQSIDTINDSAIKLDTTVSSIEKLNATLFNQVDDLRKLGTDLKFNFQHAHNEAHSKRSGRGRHR